MSRFRQVRALDQALHHVVGGNSLVGWHHVAGVPKADEGESVHLPHIAGILSLALHVAVNEPWSPRLGCRQIVVDLEFLKPVHCAGDGYDRVDLSTVFIDLHLVLQKFRVQVVRTSCVLRVVQRSALVPFGRFHLVDVNGRQERSVFLEVLNKTRQVRAWCDFRAVPDLSAEWME